MYSKIAVIDDRKDIIEKMSQALSKSYSVEGLQTKNIDEAVNFILSLRPQKEVAVVLDIQLTNGGQEGKAIADKIPSNYPGLIITHSSYPRTDQVNIMSYLGKHYVQKGNVAQILACLGDRCDCAKLRNKVQETKRRSDVEKDVEQYLNIPVNHKKEEDLIDLLSKITNTIFGGLRLINELVLRPEETFGYLIRQQNIAALCRPNLNWAINMLSKSLGLPPEEIMTPEGHQAIQDAHRLLASVNHHTFQWVKKILKEKQGELEKAIQVPARIIYRVVPRIFPNIPKAKTLHEDSIYLDENTAPEVVSKRIAELPDNLTIYIFNHRGFSPWTYIEGQNQTFTDSVQIIATDVEGGEQYGTKSIAIKTVKTVDKNTILIFNAGADDSKKERTKRIIETIRALRQDYGQPGLVIVTHDDDCANPDYTVSTCANSDVIDYVVGSSDCSCARPIAAMLRAIVKTKNRLNAN